MRANPALMRTLLMLLGAAVSLSGQATTDWKNGIVKIETNAGAPGAPGAGFVVAVGADHVFIVTAAHVVAGDSNPSIFFAIDEDNPFPGNVIGPDRSERCAGRSPGSFPTVVFSGLSFSLSSRAAGSTIP